MKNRTKLGKIMRKAMGEHLLLRPPVNGQYIEEPYIVPVGYKGRTSACPRLDAIFIPAVSANFEKLEKYAEALKSGKKYPAYRLGIEDFDKEAISPNPSTQSAVPGWNYYTYIYEYKSLDANSLRMEHVISAEKNARLICENYDLERRHLRVLIFVRAKNNIDANAKTYLDKLREDGFNFTVLEGGIPMSELEKQ